MNSHLKPTASRRAVLKSAAAFATLGLSHAAHANVDGRVAQVARGLREVDRHTLNGVSLLRAFGGYFPIPNHFALLPGEPYCRFVNMRGENQNDALDGFIVAASLEHLSEHDSVVAALNTPVRSTVLRYGLTLELRRHEPPEPLAPPTPSVFISNARDFVWILGDNADLWPLMCEAYGRLPRTRARLGAAR
ncbi:MAG TPA: hypothetical protein VJ764_08500 [Steroidobacteraceae bacterium]|nr:hypothetical protein [Steroidobacteraceae bacterium]